MKKLNQKIISFLIADFLKQVKRFFTGQVIDQFSQKKKYQVIDQFSQKKKYRVIHQITEAQDKALKYVEELRQVGFEEAWQEREDTKNFLLEKQKLEFKVGKIFSQIDFETEVSALNDRYFEMRQATDDQYLTGKQKIENIKGQIDAKYDYNKPLSENFLLLQSTIMLEAIGDYYCQYLEATKNAIKARQSARKSRYDKILAILRDENKGKNLLLLAIEDDYAVQMSEIEQVYRNDILVAEEKLSSVQAPSDRHFHGYEIKCEIRREGLSTFTCIELTASHQEDKREIYLSKPDIPGFLNSVFDLPERLKGVITIHHRSHISYQQADIETHKLYLHSVCELLSHLADIYPAIIAAGGKAVPVLQQFLQHRDHQVRQVVLQLIQHISVDTSLRLAHHASILLCSNCLIRCAAHDIDLSSGKPITFYGCRSCWQSQEFIEWDGEIVAVLDNQMAANRDQDNNSLKINWLKYRVLFDFDRIELINANDEDVERFAVQVGNDTDIVRKPRYKQIQCLVWPECELSENSMRILQYTFGEVEIKDFVSSPLKSQRPT